jgi:4'-phosphopantetheinyl transferase
MKFQDLFFAGEIWSESRVAMSRKQMSVDNSKILTVDVWTIEVGSGLSFCDSEVNSILSREEVGRARRFRFEKDARRFLYRRLALRKLLSRYFCQRPEKLVFRFNENGKPWVFNDGDVSISWKFNFSHSADVAMLALVREHEVGIDVEYSLKPLPDLYDVLRVVCSRMEFEQFRALPESCHQEAFYKIWTTKEAYLKALGTGLSREPDTVHLKIGWTGDDVALTFDDPEETGWQFVSCVPRQDYLATLALRTDRAIEINQFSFPDSL